MSSWASEKLFITLTRKWGRSVCYIVGCFIGTTLPAFAPSACADDSEFFEKHVRPLLVQACYECHSTDHPDGGLDLQTAAGVQAGGDSGAAVVPGKTEESLLVEAVRYQNRDLQMPPDGKLPDDAIEILEKWVQLGAPDPRTETARAKGPSMGMSIEEGQKFWAFQSISDPPIPNVQQSDWVRTPIDAFVLSELERLDIKPAQPADKRTLIRRVTFNLTGLPPTPEEVAEFVTDESDDAFSKVVGRLLNSSAYGVRWGRHWLDVARYADSNGLDENLAFGNAWRYRDYVVESFNKDKPFDRFLIEHLAGDLLPDSNEETITATGFLVLGAKVLAEPDREKLEMDTIDEQLDTIGKAFLGMTIGCARCHDHKFDPLLQSDYYALAAIFKSTKTFGDTNTGAIKHWYEHSFATEQQLEELKKVDAEIARLKSSASSFKSKAMADIRTSARGKAAEYLMAASMFSADATLKEVAKIAERWQLHPRILHHCRRHLLYNADDPVFAYWHNVTRSATPDNKAGRESIEEHYRLLFQQVHDALTEARKANPKAQTIGDKKLEAARKALFDPSGFLTVPAKPEFAFDEQTLTEYHKRMEAARIAESGAPDAHAVMGVTDGTVLASLPIHIRGSHRNLGELIERGFPKVMQAVAAQPTLPSDQSSRLELANWMASADHPLTARVYANRIWRWHFGTGLVGTTENFGVLGDRPTNPDLLDWLASELIRSGWSTKHLHRLILSSSVYQMSSSHGVSDVLNVDPENRLLWKFPLQRLDAEQIRDSILAVSGRLDDRLGGKTVPLRNRQFVFDHTSIDHTKYDSLRRSIYLPVIRNNVYSFFGQFDFPDPTMPTGSRHSTVVAPQALLMMNAELVMDSADQFATTLMESPQGPERVVRAYERALARPPTAAEIRRALAFIKDCSTASESNGTRSLEAQHQSWSMFCQSLFASNEFIYVR